MGKKQKGRERKSARKERRAEEREREKEFEAMAEAARQKRKRWLILIPTLTLVAAAVCWFGLDDRRLVGVSALIGVLLFLMVALGSIGAEVQPRDRTRSGSIDFGTRDQ